MRPTGKRRRIGYALGAIEERHRTPSTGNPFRLSTYVKSIATPGFDAGMVSTGALAGHTACHGIRREPIPRDLSGIRTPAVGVMEVPVFPTGP